MIIALDYDGTYTADPDLWDSFIVMAKSRGHQILIVTMGSQKSVDGCECISTHCQAKKQHLKQMDISVDIWIDDCPDSIFHDAYRG